MVNLSQFFPRLLPYVVGCPEPLARQALLDSAIDFCNRASVISVDLDPVTVIKDITEYEVETPDQTSVATTLKVWYDGKLLAPVPFDDATGIYSMQPGTPRFYYGSFVDEAYVLTLMPKPDKTLANGLRIRVALTPTRTASKVDSLLFERYSDAIVAGAVGIIAAIPDQSFTDFTRASAAQAQARTISSVARGEIMHGNVQASMSVKMRAF